MNKDEDSSFEEMKIMMFNRSLRNYEGCADEEFSRLQSFQVLPIIFLSDYPN